jgi:phosphoserine phosphatase
MAKRTHFITIVYPQNDFSGEVPITDKILTKTLELINNHNGKDVQITRLSDNAFDIFFNYKGGVFELDEIRHYVDCGIGKTNSRDKKIFISDMDSTIIAHEALDDVAEHLGLKEQVTKITNLAMSGKINFESSLKQRVKLLSGKSAQAFDVVHSNLIINQGAETTLKTLKKHNVKTALVSGGFDITVKLVAEKLGFDYTYANTIEFDNGIITGNVIGDILGQESKKQILLSLCEKYNTTPKNSIAIGDGANDLDMINCSDMGIAYVGKPIVRKDADFQINLTDFTTVLYFMGLKKSDWAS